MLSGALRSSKGLKEPEGAQAQELSGALRSTKALDTSVSITLEVNSLQTGLCCGCTRSSTIEVLPLSCYSEVPTDHNQPCDCCD